MRPVKVSSGSKAAFSPQSPCRELIEDVASGAYDAEDRTFPRCALLNQSDARRSSAFPRDIVPRRARWTKLGFGAPELKRWPYAQRDLIQCKGEPPPQRRGPASRTRGWRRGVSSLDLENVILQHPAIMEAAVIGVPDPKWTERPLALVARARQGDCA